MSRAFTSPLAKSLYSSPQQVTPPIQSSASPQQAKRVSTPRTPSSQYPSPLPRTPLSVEQTPTGKWAHPAVSKVASLQFRKAPNDTTLRRILYNIAALFVLYKTSSYAKSLVQNQSADVIKYTNWAIYTLYILLTYNVAENLRRFWWTNTYDDPSLTAKQRNLLNLPASPIPASSRNVAPITPPKYQKSYTPSPATQSPLAGKQTYNSASPTYQTASPLARSSSGLLSSSPSSRNMTLLNGSSSQQLSLSSDGSRASPDFPGSAKWRYTQSMSKLQA